MLMNCLLIGITILEVVISITCIQTVIHIIQTISVMFITYFVFLNPIEITNGLFVFVFIVFLTGWLGLLYGTYFFIHYLVFITILHFISYSILIIIPTNFVYFSFDLQYT